jgi:LmbE family N-acetylglucosaminyl deacetylase
VNAVNAIKTSSVVKGTLAYSMALGLMCSAAPSLHAQNVCPTQGSERVNAEAIPENRGAAALSVALQQLHTRASMLMIVAHPDDEDGATLAYTSRTLGARVGLLTLNRGEGGANVMSSDLWDSLGLVRTEELLQADRYYCATEYFTTAADYGFSKTLDEALEKWGGDGHVFSDVVRVVRLTRPLILSSVFVGGPTDGHGNHQAAGRWAQKVFLAAGDPNVFPEQLKDGLHVWNPYKEYARVPFARPGFTGVQNYITGKFEPGPVSVTVKIPTGTYIPANGLSAQQISRTGLGYQKSQNGGGEMPAAGPATSAYHRFGSRMQAPDQENSFFDGIDITLQGIAGLAGDQEHGFLTQGLDTINGLVEQAMHNYSIGDPSAIAPMLADGMAATDRLIDQVKSSTLSGDAKYNVLHELDVKHLQFNDALALSLGLSMEANVTNQTAANPPPARGFGRANQPNFQMAIPGQEFRVLVHIANDSAASVTVDKVALKLNGSVIQPDPAAGNTTGPVAASGISNTIFKVNIPEAAPFTKPYFSRPSIDQAYYDVLQPEYRNLPLAPYPLEAEANLTFHGAQIELTEAVQVVDREEGAGTLFHPLPIGPAISLTMVQSDGIIPLDRTMMPVSVRIHSNVKGAAQGSVHLDLPAGWKSMPANAPFSFAQDGQEQIATFQVTPSNMKEQTYHIKAVASYDAHEYKEGYVQVGYPGLRPYYLYSAANYNVTGTNVKVSPNLQIGYIEGSGDDVPASLEDLGIHVHFLSQADLASGDLQKYSEILVGVRAYAVREDLRTFNGRLLNYVKNGGVVVVQYQTPEFDHNFGPYPYTMPNPEEVTDEHSVVTILDPSNPLMKSPNVITSKDFDGWIEERGSKFLRTWDPQYEPLLETHDPGQAPQKGGMLVAHYGSGTYVYTAYAFYRELPLGVPGAYRIFANLLSISSDPHSKAK